MLDDLEEIDRRKVEEEELSISKHVKNDDFYANERKRKSKDEGNDGQPVGEKRFNRLKKRNFGATRFSTTSNI